MNNNSTAANIFSWRGTFEYLMINILANPAIAQQSTIQTAQLPSLTLICRLSDQKLIYFSLFVCIVQNTAFSPSTAIRTSNYSYIIRNVLHYYAAKHHHGWGTMQTQTIYTYAFTICTYPYSTIASVALYTYKMHITFSYIPDASAPAILTLNANYYITSISRRKK